MVISLAIFPGQGLVGSRTVDDGTTLADFVSNEGLEDRSICLNGQDILSSLWKTTLLTSGDEVVAVTPTKGN